MTARFDELLDETVALFGSMADKIMAEEPTWAELDTVLTDEERLIFDAFMAWSVSDSGHPQASNEAASEKGPVGP